MKKVYCEDCKHFHYRYTIYWCKHPDNIVDYDTFLKRYSTCENSPDILNKNNDCGWFSQKMLVIENKPDNTFSKSDNKKTVYSYIRKVLQSFF